MITEQELERVLALREKIKDLRVFISKLESSKVSKTTTMNSKVSIDSITIDVNDYTVATLKRFHREIVHDYRHKLHMLEEEYNSIIFSPEEAFERALLDDEEEEQINGEEED